MGSYCLANMVRKIPPVSAICVWPIFINSSTAFSFPNWPLIKILTLIRPPEFFSTISLNLLMLASSEPPGFMVQLTSILTFAAGTFPHI